MQKHLERKASASLYRFKAKHTPAC